MCGPVGRVGRKHLSMEPDGALGIPLLGPNDREVERGRCERRIDGERLLVSSGGLFLEPSRLGDQAEVAGGERVLRIQLGDLLVQLDRSVEIAIRVGFECRRERAARVAYVVIWTGSPAHAPASRAARINMVLNAIGAEACPAMLNGCRPTV